MTDEPAGDRGGVTDRGRSRTTAESGLEPGARLRADGRTDRTARRRGDPVERRFDHLERRGRA